MERNPLLLLIGLRCSGKTTLGEAVASSMGVAWRDLDTMALDRLGCSSVSEAFEKHGEPGWRDAESSSLLRVLETPTLGVLSLGGGAATTPAAAVGIRAAQASGHAVVVLLHPGHDELVRRLAQGRGDRPRLARDDDAEVRHLSAARLPLYRSIADACVDTRMPRSACVERLAAITRLGRWTWPSRPATG